VTQESGPVWTIGHSTRPLHQFLDLLNAHSIEAIADVRRYPASRRWPQFGGDALAAALETRGIGYLWIPELGGRREPRPDSPNTAWRNAGFRGYADHMGTETFARGLVTLTNLSLGVRTAIMCAEAVWWRCHRALVADVLRWLGYEVRHILGPGSADPHPYTRAARIVDGRLSYEAARDRGGGS
jgi:uncharacterized protein (DUF488 family)